MKHCQCRQCCHDELGGREEQARAKQNIVIVIPYRGGQCLARVASPVDCVLWRGIEAEFEEFVVFPKGKQHWGCPANSLAVNHRC